MRFILLVPLLFICACATATPVNPDAKPESAPQDVSAVPPASSEPAPHADNKLGGPHTREEVSAQITQVYTAVLDGMTLKYFSAYPDLDQEHTQAMREFIKRESSPESFVAMMLSSRDREKDSEGHLIPEAKPKQEFSDTDVTVVINVSVSMAQMIIEQTRGVYVAKYVEKNPLMLELFAMDTEQKYTDWIAMVGGEVTAEDFIASCGKERDDYEYREGDRFFGFCSSQKSWEDLCGRQGYLIVRDGKILQAIITMMN